MTQGLQIIETIKGKATDREELTKQQRFNLLIDRLRERNNGNDLLIRNFIKKMAKRERHYNRAVERHRLALQLPRQSQIQLTEKQDDSPLSSLAKEYAELIRHEKDEMEKIDTLQRESCLESTANTTKAGTMSPDVKTGSFPTIEPLKSTRPQPEPNQPKTFKSNFPLAKYDSNFNNYLHNILFNEIVIKTQQNKGISPRIPNSYDLSRKSHQARVHTHAENSPSKYQLGIKEMVFGNQEIFANKRIESETALRNRTGRLMTELGYKLANTDKVEPLLPFYDGNLGSKTILPSINSAQPQKNKRSLQNFIKMNIDRNRQAKQKAKLMRLSKLQQQARLVYNNESMNRIGISFRINTLPVNAKPNK